SPDGEAGDGSGRGGTSLAARAEESMQRGLDEHLPLFRERKSLYGIFLTDFIAARNKVLGVSTSTRRPMQPSMYSTNVEIIEATLRFLASRNVHAVIYFAPIRPIEPNPYDPTDVKRFRRDMADVCARNRAVFLDYSGLVPEEMWTNYPDSTVGKGGQRDYAHF